MCVCIYLCVCNLTALKSGQKQTEFREDLILKRRCPYALVESHIYVTFFFDTSLCHLHDIEHTNLSRKPEFY